jgi:hypothetical protein
MNRDSTTTLIALSVLGGILATALTMVTSTGMVGVYVFGVTATLAVVAFMGWPDIRKRLPRRQASTVHHRTKSRHARRRVRLP